MRKVIFSCFAGRKRYMEILSVYIRILKERKYIDEIHMWDYTRNEDDSKWLEQEWSKDAYIFKVENKSNYIEYYKYYADKERYPENDTVLIKCDDDILYIDVDSFEIFIQNRREHTYALVTSPLVVNNTVCSHLLKSQNQIEFKDDDDFFSSEYAEFIHKKFLDGEIIKSNRCVGYIPNKEERFSINFIAILSKDFELLGNKWFENDDERTFSHMAGIFERPIVIDSNMIVSHMAYTKQRINGFDETEFLKTYSNKTADFLKTA